jgi:hypothetical protein
MFPSISGTSQGCSRVSQGHLRDVPEYPRDTSGISQGYLRDVPEYPRDTSGISQGYLRDVPEYPRDISGISEAYHLVIFHIGSKYFIIV